MTERRANLRPLLNDAKSNSEKDYLKLVEILPDLIGAVCREGVGYLILSSDPERPPPTTGGDSCMPR